MPGFDRTGPEGQGSRTGRAMGKCNPENRKNKNVSEDEDFVPGRGLRLGLGRRFGRGSGKGVGRGMGRGYGRD
ncbi:DUF5320 domain-containing protein [Bacteroidota bacterium]